VKQSGIADPTIFCPAWLVGKESGIEVGLMGATAVLLMGICLLPFLGANSKNARLHVLNRTDPL
jgi:hypothetical protein